jgi:hypothetical protein
MNSCRVEFEDGYVMITSRNALKRAQSHTKHSSISRALPPLVVRAAMRTPSREVSEGETMVRVHPTRLMREGEAALWQGGSIIWQGSVGTRLEHCEFDAVSVNSNDLPRFTALAEALTPQSILRALACWWECDERPRARWPCRG